MGLTVFCLSSSTNKRLFLLVFADIEKGKTLGADVRADNGTHFVYDNVFISEMLLDFLFQRESVRLAIGVFDINEFRIVDTFGFFAHFIKQGFNCHFTTYNLGYGHKIAFRIGDENGFYLHCRADDCRRFFEPAAAVQMHKVVDGEVVMADVAE